MRNAAKRIFSLGLVLVMALGLLNGLALPAVAAEPPKTGDDGITNWDFVEPVTHLTKAPDGYTEIHTAAELNAVRENLSKNYILMADIDLSDWGNWVSIGSDIFNAFKGVFDGNGYVIQNMSINIESTTDAIYAGLFGLFNGTVKNLGLPNGSVNAVSSAVGSYPAAYAGGIIGETGYAAVAIANCYSGATVSATAAAENVTVYAGGIAGRADIPISACLNKGEVLVSSLKSDTYAGGISGYLFSNSAITACHNTGAITALSSDGSPLAGGIVGNASSAPITHCDNAGRVSAAAAAGNPAFAGGIAARSSSSSVISNCRNSGAVTADAAAYYAYAGGIVGDSFSSSISSCHNSGAVSATCETAAAGGIVGVSYSPISACYNTGAITASSASTSSFANAHSGGIAGNATLYSPISNCYNAGTVNAASVSPAAYAYAYAGGIAGNLSSTTISACYNLANASASASGVTAFSTAFCAGSIAGYASYSSAISDCYFINSNAKACGDDNGSSTNVLALSHAQMRQKSSFAGFNFGSVWTLSSEGYPHIQGLPEPAFHSSLKLDKTTLTLGIKESHSLTAVMDIPLTLLWTSSNTKVVTVDANGKLTANAAGTAVIAATTASGKTAKCTVTVLPAPSSVKLSQASVTLGKGESFALTATLNPSASASKKKTWSSSNTAVAAVDANGKITAKAAGTATITFQTYNGKSATCKVTVKNAPSSVKLSRASVTLGVKESYTPAVSFNDTSAASCKRSWASSNTAVASVDANGKITAVKAGKATITVTTFNSKKASIVVTVNAAPTGIKLSKTAVTLKLKESFTPTVSFNPADAASYKRSWVSSNTAVATVDANGKITAVKAGKATITVTSFNGKTASIVVTVNAAPPAPTSVKLSKTAVTLGVKESLTLTASYNPANAVNHKCTWSSSNKAIATVDANGKITAVKAGNATITVKTANGKSTTCKVTVKVAPTSVKLSKSAVTLEAAKSFTPTVSFSPSGAASNKRTWSSSNKAVATVDANGKITAVKAGKATITITAFNGKKAQLDVTVKAAAVTAPTSVKPSKVSLTLGVNESYTPTLSFTPASAAGSKCSWASSNKAIASVDAKGKITALKAGNATITVTTANGKKAQIAVTVKAAPTSVKLNKTSLALVKGESETLKLTFTPTSAASASCSWSSSDKTVASVDANGKVTALKAGTAIITVKAFNGRTTRCVVTVK